MSVRKLRGTAPRDSARARRDGTESIANSLAGLNERAEIRAQRPTGPQPMRAMVVVGWRARGINCRALEAAKYPLMRGIVSWNCGPYG